MKPRAMSMSFGHRALICLTRQRLLACTVAVVLAGLAGDVVGATLTHTYRFDPSRLDVVETALGKTLVADDLPSTWEQDRPEIPYALVTLLVPQTARVKNVTAKRVGEHLYADQLSLGLASTRFNEAGEASHPRESRWIGKAGLPEVYPPLDAEPAGGGALHGYQLATVRVYPIHYEASTGRVFVSTELSLEIELAHDAEMPLERERFSREGEERARAMVQSLVSNPETIATYARRIGALSKSQPGGFSPSNAPSLEGSPVDYVIITPQALEASFQVLADWKTRRGIPTVVRTLEWINANYRHGSDQQETIRNFIQDAYAKWAVQWVLLGGDTGVLPARIGYSQFGPETDEDIPTDMYFACLDGNWNKDGDALWGEAAVTAEDSVDAPDMYAEIFVGRLPVETPAETNLIVSKIMEYENPSESNYQQETLLLGEVLFPVDWDTSLSVSMDGGGFSEELAAMVGACPNVTRLYENHLAFPGSQQLTLANTLIELNEGKGFVNHIGHGFRYNMSCGDRSLINADAFSLTNGNKRFVLYMLNCTATAFDFPCLAEAFLMANGGAVAVLGSSRAAFALPSRNYNVGFFEALHDSGVVNIGATFVQSRIKYTPNTWFDTSDHYTHYLYNMLADPEMVVHTCSLSTTAATFPSAIALGPTQVSINVTADGVPHENALVCLQKGDEEYVYGRTDATGNVMLEFVAESGGTIELTVSGHNITTLLDSITVDPSTSIYVHATALTMDDDSSGSSQGNGDGQPDAAEIIELDVTFVNDGDSDALGVSGVLRINSPWAVVLDSTYTLGALNAGDSIASSGQLRFSIINNAPDGTILPLTFESTNGVSTWTDVINRVVHAPDLELTLLDVDDPAPGGNGDGKIQAGETFNLIAYFKNYGTGTANGLQTSLIPIDPDVVVTTNSSSVGDAMPLQEVTGATAFRLTENTLDENALILTLTDSYSRSTLWNITLRGPAKPATPVPDASGGADVVVNSWQQSSDPDLAGYHLYRATTASGPWTRVTVDRTVKIAYYRDTGLSPSTQYFYYVTAIDEDGNESEASEIGNINTSPAQLSGWPILLLAESSCPAAVGDITGDGLNEIVAGNDNLYAWEWNGIELLDDDGDPQTWGVFASEIGIITGAVILADFDAQPGYEIFAASWEDSNKTFIVRGDGSIPSGWPQAPNPTSAQKGYWGSPGAIDIDGDGLAEVFAPAKNGNLYAWHADGSPVGASVAFKSGLGTWSRCSPTFGRVDTDPYPEIIYGAPNGTLHVWNADGTYSPNFPLSVGSLCLSSTAVGDVNNDGRLDIVMVVEDDLINVVDATTGTQLPGWPVSLSVASNPISPSPALADFDFDGYLEIVVAHNAYPVAQSAVRVYDHQGNLKPGWPRLVDSHTSESSPIVADFSGDGVPDIVFGNESGFIFGWDKDGNELIGFPLTIGDFIRSTPYATDVDDDGDIDLVLAGWDKKLWIWDFPAAYDKAAAQWPTFKHDAQRTGNYHFRHRTATDVGGEEDVIDRVPSRAFLSQNVPNPFNPLTTIAYGVPSEDGREEVAVRLDIFDVMGRHVRQLVHGSHRPGAHKTIWDGRDDSGRRVQSGVFFYRLQVAEETITRKMLLLK